MSECKCSMRIQVLGDGCRYCQPQTYIDKLSEIIDDERSEHEEHLAATVKESLTAGKAQMARDSAELRRLCAERDQLKAKCVALEDYAAAVEKSAEKLEAELATLKEIPEQAEIAGYKASDGSLMSAESGAMFTATYMGKYEPLITLAHHNAIVSSLKAKAVVPDRVAMAKALCNYHADLCGVSRDDQWFIFSDAFLNDVDVMLAAATAQPAAPEVKHDPAL